ncbi:MAG: esterase-like activity of phytase family protein [Gemmatirosa sp.]
MQTRLSLVAAAVAVATLADPAHAQTVGATQFVNGIAIAGDTPDLSTGSVFDRRLGFFSDLYYDSVRNEWWGLSDRGPGGGTLPYGTRVQRFTLGVDQTTGQIGNFQVQQTILFRDGAAPLNGLAPSPVGVLGNALDPEGFAINPLTGTLLVSDEYGPSLYEFDRDGTLLRRFSTPDNLIPRNAEDVPNFASDAGNIAGKRTNRGFEGLAISPDGRYAYATLQSAMLDEGGGDGVHVRIVKFDVLTGQSVAQYAYRMDGASQGRGLSAIIALGNDRFLVIERNNRGVGVGADVASPNKNVYAIDLAGATDVSNVAITNGTLPPGVVTVAKSANPVIDLDANTLGALGNKSPEKWEGLTVGPQLADGRYVIVAGTDNDYSVTQNADGVQFDVYFDFSAADPYAASIQCPVGTTTGCTFTTGGGAATLTSAYRLVPGVLHAYTARIDGYVAPFVTPEPQSIALTAVGLGLLAAARRRRTRAG